MRGILSKNAALGYNLVISSVLANVEVPQETQ
jgi:hypothetical protein